MINPILIIGIDGGTWDILKPAINEGFMPNLKSIIEKDSHGTLKSVIPAITPAAWSSFQTGKNPGHNGVYDFQQWITNTLSSKVVNSTNITNTIWELASNAGKKVGVLNVPMTYPPKIINGNMVTGLLTPNLSSSFTFPAEFKQQLFEKIPDYQILNFESSFIKLSEIDLEDFLEKMIMNLEHRLKACKFMLQEQNCCDLFMVHFQASDVVQHVLWGYMLPEHPLFDKDKQQTIYKNFYNKLDVAIQESIDAFQANCNKEHSTFIISDHGFQSNYHHFNLTSWLAENDFVSQEYVNFHTKQRLLKNNKDTQKKNSPSTIVKLAKKIGIGKLASKFLSKESVKQLEIKTNLKKEKYDYQNDKVKFLHSCREGFIFILEQDPEKKQTIIDDIINKLSKVKDPKTGKIIAQNIFKANEIYKGDNIALMPDITIVPIENWTYVNMPENPDFIIDVDFESTLHIGTHSPDGIIAIHGPHVTNSEIIDAEIIDIAPTIAWLLNIDTNIEFDGKILKSYWDSHFIASLDSADKTVANIDSNGSKGNTSNYSKQESEDVEARLKDLGYL